MHDFFASVFIWRLIGLKWLKIDCMYGGVYTYVGEKDFRPPVPTKGGGERCNIKPTCVPPSGRLPLVEGECRRKPWDGSGGHSAIYRKEKGKRHSSQPSVRPPLRRRLYLLSGHYLQKEECMLPLPSELKSNSQQLPCT